MVGNRVNATERERLDTINNAVMKIALLLGQTDDRNQGVILADLLARWVACYSIEGSDERTAILREEMLTSHLKLVHKLIPEHARFVSRVSIN